MLIILILNENSVSQDGRSDLVDMMVLNGRRFFS